MKLKKCIKIGEKITEFHGNACQFVAKCTERVTAMKLWYYVFDLFIHLCMYAYVRAQQSSNAGYS